MVKATKNTGIRAIPFIKKEHPYDPCPCIMDTLINSAFPYISFSQLNGFSVGYGRLLGWL